MLQLVVKAAISGIVVAVASEVARRWPGWGALIVSLPLVSVLTMIWLWHDTHDRARLEAHAGATLGCVLTVVLYSGVVWAGPRFGLKL